MDTSKIDRHIGRLLTRLSRLQNADGSWGDNNFVTGLVACSLAEIKNGNKGGTHQNTLRKTLEHILSEKSEGWSWNYRSRSGMNATDSNPKYPDDLDDTCVSLISLVKTRADPDMSGIVGLAALDDRAFTHIAQLLMNAETREGGPYNTWLVKTKAERSHSHWHDVDPAVNANVSYFLSLSNISLPRLTSYIDNVIRKNRYHSKYYHNPLLVMYFISRGYAGKEKEKLIMHVTKHQTSCMSAMSNMPHVSPDSANIFDMVLSAHIYMNLGEPVEKISPYIERVIRFCNSAFPVPALYMEKKGRNPSSGEIEVTYARSEAVLVALCAEMLSTYRARLISDADKQKEDLVYAAIVQETEKVLKSLPAGMRRDGHALLMQTLEHDAGRTITLLPARTAHRTVSKILKSTKSQKNRKIRFETIVACGLMSLYGWIAYTIYDDTIDGENFHAGHIPLANIFHREMTALVANMPPDVRSLFRHTMNILDSAEYRECRNRISDIRAPAASIRPSSLSHNAWRKSAGFIFPSACIMMHAGHALGSPLLKDLVGFFRHYLSAKQIADDIRDWEEDLLGDILTPVTAFILGAPRVNSDSDSEKKLEKIFLEHALEPSAREVLRHAVSARKILASRTMRQNFSDTAFLSELARPHEEAARKTLDRLKTGHDQTINKS